MPVPIEVIRRLPKVALHDHLDGGLRPATIVAEAAVVGHELPTTDPAALGEWFYEAANSGSLVRYLETFDHTIAVMQTRDQLRRVAREFVEDQAADGVVYAEARWAPEQHLARGLTLTEAVEAVRDGLAEGMAGCAAADRGPPDPHLDAPQRPDHQHRRTGDRLSLRLGLRLRYRRRRGRLSAQPVRGRLRLPQAAQLRVHHPRR